jgi:hypothetical protein
MKGSAITDLIDSESNQDMVDPVLGKTGDYSPS